MNWETEAFLFPDPHLPPQHKDTQSLYTLYNYNFLPVSPILFLQLQWAPSTSNQSNTFKASHGFAQPFEDLETTKTLELLGTPPFIHKPLAKISLFFYGASSNTVRKLQFKKITTHI